VRLSHVPTGAWTVLALLALPASLAAQSSLFGVRGLGHPGRPLMPRAIATGGSFALFDGESDFNPAAMANLRTIAANFVLTPDWRQWDVPAGAASLRETRFPLFAVGGPVPGTRLALGLSFGSYADRDFRLATRDTVALRGVPVGVHDTLTSTGGMNEIRLAVGYALSSRTTIGGGIYWITGSNRFTAHRSFADTTFLALRQSAELSYQGLGFSLGVTHQLTSRLQLAALVRSDGRATVDKDSTKVYTVDLPYTVSAGVQYRPASRLLVAASGTYRTWSGANSDLQAQGGLGSRNTLEAGFGVEFIRDVRRPTALPIRLGVRYADLPFPLESGAKPHEFSLSAGTAKRFAQDRAGVEVALEHAWRSEGSQFKERAFMLTIGLSIRPYGTAR
jgi:hypothetical protein